jgi:DNA-binding CsgD family transcriptional regulator
MSTRQDAAAALLDRLGEVVLELDLGDDPPRVVHGNRTALELLGAEPDAATRALLAALHPDDRIVFDGQCALARGGIARSADCRVIDAAGEIRWLRGSMRPALPGQPTAHYVALDVTEERRLLAGLASVGDDRRPPRAVDDGAFVYEIARGGLRVVLADATMRCLAGRNDPTGLDPGVAVGPFLHADDAGRFMDWLRRLARREAATVRYRVGAPGERPRTVVAAAMPRRLADGRTLISGLALETAGEPAAEVPSGGLLAGGDYLRAWEHGPDGRVVRRFESVGMFEMLGYAVESDDPAAFWRSCVHPDDQVAYREQLEPARPGGDLHYRVLAADGTARWIHDRYRRTRLAGGGWLDEGVVTDLSAARAAAATRGRQPQREPAEGHVALTARQREILDLLCAGLNARQIARQLQLSERTVGNHVNAILHRLGVHSRSEAVAKAFRLGLA